MVATAILSADPSLTRSLEDLLRNDASITFLGVADQPSKLLGLAERHRIDVVLVHEPLVKEFTESAFLHDATAWAAIMDRADEASSLIAFRAGASAILCRSATGNEIVCAINAVAKGMVVLQRFALSQLIDPNALLETHRNRSNNFQFLLTPRELQVLTAMADGASNKAIARRLGISVHTVKFHVGAILVKLDADSRTEAVTKAAQQGIIML